MENKTKVYAEDNKHTIRINRTFDLPLNLLFKAYSEAEFIEQWMGTKVIKHESKKHGSYQFLTTDPHGNKHGFHGVFHEFNQNKKIIRTFEMVDTIFPPQLEFLEFEQLSDEKSNLNILIVCKSMEDRNAIMKLPFAYGINMAHNKLQSILDGLK